MEWKLKWNQATIWHLCLYGRSHLRYRRTFPIERNHRFDKISGKLQVVSWCTKKAGIPFRILPNHSHNKQMILKKWISIHTAISSNDLATWLGHLAISSNGLATWLNRLATSSNDLAIWLGLLAISSNDLAIWLNRPATSSNDLAICKSHPERQNYGWKKLFFIKR